MNKYNKIVFVNGSAPPLNADNLNHMDEGIERAIDEAIALETEIATARGDSADLNTRFTADEASLEAVKSEITTARGSHNSLGARLDTVDANLANKADNSTTLAGYGITDGENIGNKVTDKRKITDKDANYPSIGYLHDYYYDCNEVDDALSGKLGNTAGSVTTDNIASKAVTTEKLAEDVTNQLSKLKDDIGDRNITLDFNYDGYIDKKGEFNTLVSFKTTDFIAISSRVIVKGEFRDLNSPLYYINCYGSNKNYLGGTINAISSGNKIVNVNGVVTLIEGTCFIRVTNSRRSISMVKMGYSLSDTGDLSSVNQKIEESKTNNSIYSNIINDGLGFSVFSKFASVGDSLSVGYNTEKDGTPISEDLKHSWGAYIEKRCGTKSFWTGKSGQTCKTWLNTTSETWGLNYCKSIGTMPLYVICMGANEPGINIGTTDDIDTDNDTLYGYVSKVINELRNISPKSYIVCTGVSREQNSHSINDVYKTICDLKEKCYYLDCFKEFNSEPFTSYFFNWHYSANGYSAMANLFDYKLKEVMAKNVEDFKYVNEADN